MKNELTSTVSIRKIDSIENKKIASIDAISTAMGKVLPRADSRIKMIVTIPAKDEGQLIKNSLMALIRQETLNGTALDKSLFEVLVLCHNCSDDTYEQCLEVAAAYPEFNLLALVLNSEQANTVGSARRVLMNIASQRLGCSNGFIISTDADTIPDRQWLAQLETFLERPVALVCGIIKTDKEGLTNQAISYLKLREKYWLLVARLEAGLIPNSNDPWPRHNTHCGPNMAIKKFVYDDVGGISLLYFLEDLDLYHRVVKKGYPIRHCVKTKVVTSTRIDSRCTDGFGAEMRVWTKQEGIPYNVEGLNKLLVRYMIYQLVQELFVFPSNEIINRISRYALIDRKSLLRMYEQSGRYEEMLIPMEKYLNTNEEWNFTHPDINIVEACIQLQSYFSTPRMC